MEGGRQGEREGREGWMEERKEGGRSIMELTF